MRIDTLVRKTDAGMTLLEVLIAMAIFSFGSLGVLGLTLTSIKMNQSSRYFSEANLLAQWKFDQVAVGTPVATCLVATPCWADGTAVVASGPKTVTTAEMLGGVKTGAKYQLTWSNVAQTTGTEKGLYSVHVTVRWPRNRDLMGLPETAGTFLNCYSTGASCYELKLDGYR